MSLDRHIAQLIPYVAPAIAAFVTALTFAVYYH